MTARRSAMDTEVRNDGTELTDAEKVAQQLAQQALDAELAAQEFKTKLMQVWNIRGEGEWNIAIEKECVSVKN